MTRRGCCLQDVFKYGLWGILPGSVHSIDLKSISKFHFALLLPMNRKNAKERDNLLLNTERIFKTAHLGKCVSTVLEGKCEPFLLLFLPVNNNGTKERDSFPFDTECIFKTARLAEYDTMNLESTSKISLVIRSIIF